MTNGIAEIKRGKSAYKVSRLYGIPQSKLKEVVTEMRRILLDGPLSLRQRRKLLLFPT